MDRRDIYLMFVAVELGCFHLRNPSKLVIVDFIRLFHTWEILSIVFSFDLVGSYSFSFALRNCACVQNMHETPFFFLLLLWPKTVNSNPLLKLLYQLLNPVISSMRNESKVSVLTEQRLIIPDRAYVFCVVFYFIFLPFCDEQMLDIACVWSMLSPTILTKNINLWEISPKFPFSLCNGLSAFHSWVFCAVGFCFTSSLSLIELSDFACVQTHMTTITLSPL